MIKKKRSLEVHSKTRKKIKMANIEIFVKGSLLKQSVVVRALFANNSQTTQISRRLAEKLGLRDFENVYVYDYLHSGSAFKWKISVHPIIVTSNRLQAKNIVTYPVVNCQPEDAFYEMILGQDCMHQDFSLFNVSIRTNEKPTPGPGYEAGVHYMGHNVNLVSVDDISDQIDEFFEFPCISNVVQRIAVNKLTHQLAIAVRQDSEEDEAVVHLFDQVPDELLAKFVKRDANEELVLEEVKKVCPACVIDAFPETVLMGFSTEPPTASDERHQGHTQVGAFAQFLTGKDLKQT